jgi:hypothetical protein
LKIKLCPDRFRISNQNFKKKFLEGNVTLLCQATMEEPQNEIDRCLFGSVLDHPVIRTNLATRTASRSTIRHYATGEHYVSARWPGQRTHPIHTTADGPAGGRKRHYHHHRHNETQELAAATVILNQQHDDRRGSCRRADRIGAERYIAASVRARAWYFAPILGVSYLFANG